MQFKDTLTVMHGDDLEDEITFEVPHGSSGSLDIAVSIGGCVGIDLMVVSEYNAAHLCEVLRRCADTIEHNARAAEDWDETWTRESREQQVSPMVQLRDKIRNDPAAGEALNKLLESWGLPRQEY